MEVPAPLPWGCSPPRGGTGFSLQIISFCPAGRPFLVPHGMDDVVGSKRKRKGPRKLQDFLKWFSATCECCGRTLPGCCCLVSSLGCTCRGF